MISVLIFAVNAKLGCTLEQLPEQDSGISIVGIADDQRSLVRLADTFGPNVILTQGVPSKEKLAELRIGHKDTAWVLFVDSKSERASLEALVAGASAILPLSANTIEIIVTIKMVSDGLAIFPQKLLTTLFSRAEIVDGRSGQTDSGRPRLSERERIVKLRWQMDFPIRKLLTALEFPFIP
jgi:DNA-binding NarL/FixJ family response regulator